MELTAKDVGTQWTHRNGNTYTIVVLANCDGDDPAKNTKYPPTVVYSGNNGKVWARRIDDWHRSMTRID